MYYVIDNFLADYDYLRRCADIASYATRVNEVDQAIYPGISEDIPTITKAQILLRLREFMQTNVRINTLFMRLSLPGMQAPHQAHNDVTMGQYSLMLYLNRPEHCRGGTSFVSHKELGMQYGPTSEAELSEWRRSTNIREMWQVEAICDMKPNRACIFDACRMHRAEPVGGFGKDARDGRLVLTAFFDT